MRKLTHEEIIARQQEAKSSQKIPVCVVLNNIRSLYNVGSIFRTADGAGIEKVWICGITGHPPKNQIAKTALGAEESVIWEYRRDIIDVLTELKQNDWDIVLLEQMEQSVPYQEWMPQKPTCLIVGNEIEGVDDQILSLCDRAIEIEMDGLKNSLNVAVAFGVVIYHARNCFKLNNV